MRPNLTRLVLVAVAVCSAACASRRTETAPGGCGGDWWKCVYAPERLVIQEPCVTVRGVVLSAHGVLDGDAIVYLRLDGDDAHFANRTDFDALGKDVLEIEIVCRHPVFRLFVFRCWTCRSRLRVPRVGDHIEAEGIYVQDTRHRHMELHPVTRITWLPGSPPASDGPRSHSSASRSFVSRTCSPENFSRRK
ncbi:MAG TPA: hypothetical protein VIA45_02635 [Thermoanaerobaculia bacterium]